MIYPTRMQIQLTAPVQRVYEALTDSRALETWFCEHADISLAERRYDFWGRYTPQAPTREQGHHPVTAHEPGRRIVFDWSFPGAESQVTLALLARDSATTILTVRHTDNPNAAEVATQDYGFEDFWFLSLENLRRYLDGKPSDARTDFSNPMKGDIHHETLIDAPANRVFEVLTNPEEVDRWIGTNASIAPEVGGTYDLGWGEAFAATILTLDAGKTLAYRWQEGEPPNTREMVVTWTLEESDGKTRLTFVQSGFADDEDVSGMYTGWNNFLNWVRSVSEYGAAWQPPLVPLAADAIAYPRSIIKAQEQIVDALR